MAAFTFAEFFAGIGLVRDGLEREGGQCLFANDIDPKKREMYAARFPDADDHFVLDDIHRVPASAIPRVDVATASFPCTDLSLAGGRLGLAGRQSGALWPFIELLHKLEYTRPSVVMLENVPGFLSSHGGADLRSALIALNRIGYVVDLFVIDAVRFVPQSRPRLFIVGTYRPDECLSVSESRQSYALPFEETWMEESELRPPAVMKFVLANSDIRWSLRKLPSLPRSKYALADIVEDLPLDASEWWHRTRADYLLSQMSERHAAVAERMKQTPATSYGTIFRRVRNGRSMAELRTDGTAGCLRTPKGGSGRQILFAAGGGETRVRLLTPRECARLMGADDYPIKVPVNQALFGFGDAVCVPVISWIAREYLVSVLQGIGTKEFALV